MNSKHDNDEPLQMSTMRSTRLMQIHTNSMELRSLQPVTHVGYGSHRGTAAGAAPSKEAVVTAAVVHGAEVEQVEK